jgi:hypothetical protein
VEGNLRFDLLDPNKRLVPAHFELAGHQPVGGIGRIILAEGAISGVVCRFEIATERFMDLIPALTGFLLSGKRGGDGAGADDGKDCPLDRIIRPQTAECDAARLCVIHPSPAATVAWDMVMGAAVAERQLAPAPTAA